MSPANETGMVFPIIPVVVTLVIVGVLLWAVTQFPMDATIAKLIRVAVVVFAVLYLLNLLFGGALGLRFA